MSTLAYGRPPIPRSVSGRPAPYIGPDEIIETLFIGNCVPGTSDQQLAEVFGSLGSLVTCFLLHKPSQSGYISGFVRYAQRFHAEDALQVCNHGHITVNGSVVSAQWAEKNSRPTTGIIGGPPAPPMISNGFAGDLAVHQTNQPPPLGMPSYQVNLEGPSQPVAFDTDGEEIATIWIGDVLPEAHDSDLVSACLPYGTLVTCFLLKKLSPNGYKSGFIRYSCAQEAQSALWAIENRQLLLCGGAIACKWADKNSRPTSGLVLPGQPGFMEPGNFPEPLPLTGFLTGQNNSSNPLAHKMPVPAPGSQLNDGEELTTVWIGNATPNTTDADLQAVFSAYGPLVACFLLKKPSPHGFLSGFVRYTTVEEAQLALSSVESGTIGINGSVLTARWASRNTGCTKGIAYENLNNGIGQDDSLLARAAAHGLV